MTTLSAFFFAAQVHALTQLKFATVKGDQAPAVILAERKKLLADAREMEPKATMDVAIAWFDLNSDGRPDLCSSTTSNMTYFGNPGAQIQCFIDQGTKKYKEVITVTAAPEVVEVPGTKTKGFFDISFGGPGFGKPYLFRWTGQRYE